MKIKVLLIMSGKEPQLVKIPRSIKFIKSLIGEELYKIKLDKKTMLIFNNNASINEFNRFLKNKIILGNFLIVSKKNNQFVSLKNKQIRKYTNWFRLSKHQRKIERYRDKYLEDFYFNQKIIKQRNAVEENKTKNLVA